MRFDHKTRLPNADNLVAAKGIRGSKIKRHTDMYVLHILVSLQKCIPSMIAGPPSTRQVGRERGER